jgi:hypothetical protein
MQMAPDFRCSKCDSRKPIEDFPPSKATNKGQWCRQCLREDARKRKGLQALERTTNCSGCGVSFETTYTKAQFCSRDCKDVAHKAELSKALHAAKPPRVCMWCGDSLTQEMRSDAKFCSADCNSRAHRTTRKYRRRLGESGVRPRKQPLINFAQIAGRDHWRCGLCGGAVSKKREHPDPLAPSIDHIVPLSKGGDNEPANLQLTHLRCNLSKRDRPQGEQLRII